MSVKKSYQSRDGKIIGVNYTERRSDGKIEQRQYGPGGYPYQSRNVSNPKTGKTERYNPYGRKTSK